MSNERTRAEISAIISDIEAAPAALRAVATDPDDVECYEIVRRIERKLLGLPSEPPPGNTVPR